MPKKGRKAKSPLRSYHLKQSEPYCPTCKALLDAASAPGEGGPVPGSITMCCYCASLLQFTPLMQLELLPDAVIEDMDEASQMQLKTMQKVCLQVILERAIKGDLPAQ